MPVTCSQCGHATPSTVAICPRCHYCAQTQTVVDVVAQPKGTSSPVRARTSMMRHLRRLPKEKRRRIGTLSYTVASIVPGLGHLVARRYRDACIYLILVSALLTGGVTLLNRYGQILIGLAAAVHAFSIFDHLHRRFELGFVARIFAMGGLLLVLNRYIYWPIAEPLNRTFTEVVRVRRPGALFEISRMADIIGFGIVALFIFLISVALSCYLSDFRNGRQSR